MTPLHSPKHFVDWQIIDIFVVAVIIVVIHTKVGIFYAAEAKGFVFGGLHTVFVRTLKISFSNNDNNEQCYIGKSLPKTLLCCFPHVFCSTH